MKLLNDYVAESKHLGAGSIDNYQGMLDKLSIKEVFSLDGELRNDGKIITPKRRYNKDGSLRAVSPYHLFIMDTGSGKMFMPVEGVLSALAGMEDSDIADRIELNEQAKIVSESTNVLSFTARRMYSEGKITFEEAAIRFGQAYLSARTMSPLELYEMARDRGREIMAQTIPESYLLEVRASTA